jgi:hypothetical protein
LSRTAFVGENQRGFQYISGDKEEVL